jgi:hypothetical protein
LDVSVGFKLRASAPEIVERYVILLVKGDGPLFILWRSGETPSSPLARFRAISPRLWLFVKRFAFEIALLLGTFPENF